MGRPATGCESHVPENERRLDWIQSTAGHEEPGGKMGGPSSKPKHYPVTDREQYCEGTVKSTPGGE